MKYFYYVVLLIIITGCQQQQVPEIFYDLDAQSMANKTRAMQQQVLYQAPVDMVIDKELRLFHGEVTYLDIDAQDENGYVKVKMENEMEVVLEFEVSLEVAVLLDLEMKLVVRYKEDQNKNTVIEIKKSAW
ncbi:MAG: Unknown protein [uncultured Aureispira sp.]|uniref:Uncharacterized protein n=1 Tax=uncultured Aureispira sp. TaxID=1331704 RepID=A0A6S6S6F6_9BACT|nr:MAG: Unknown protein [uncultured Aureispira sp.]